MTQSFQNYDRTICDDAEESLSKIVSKIPDCSVVLDVGCSTGMLGRYLAEKKGCIVDGVDFDSDAVELCRPKYRFTAVKNLESEPLTDVFKAEAYDYIVIADVIEHLINPDNLLLELKKLVKPHGTVIFSVPNITHIASALELLLGNFDYRKNGLLDSTHLRFYSYSSLISKLKSAGLHVWETDVVRKDIDETEFGSDQNRIFPKEWLDELVSARPDSLVYQWIVSTKIYPSLDQIESHPAIKDITAKPVFTTALYWEDCAGSGFNEINKLVGFKGDEIENEFAIEFNFRFFPGQRINRIRIDPVSEKKVVWIKSAKIVSDQNVVIWEWPGVEGESGLINAKWIDARINTGKLLSADNDDPQWYPDISAEIMQEITSGARFSFVMCSCDDIVDSLLVDALSAAKQAVSDRDNQIARLNHAVTQERHELAEMLASKSWKITRPLRFVERVFTSNPSSVARRVFSGTGYALWQALPISTKSKQKLKGKLFKTLPWAFHRTNAYHSWDAYSQSFNCSPVTNLRDEQTEGAAYEYVSLLDAAPLKQKPAKLICFYLPQFHAIPENDEWWGEGFTEWTNVKPAQPQFEGHYQPHVPGELGYYDLLDPAVQRRQVELAKLYGIGGFCFYFYWFGGKRLLEKPIENYLNNDELDLPFCLCWANENWSRRWDGLDNDILISQHHSEDDDLAFIKHISKYLESSRYIRIDGKPLLLVYRPSLLPSAKETVKRWREWCRENGIGEIYLTCTQSFDTIDPVEFGFDAAVEFPPNNTAPPSITEDIPGCSPAFAGHIYDWSVYPERSKNYQEPAYTLFRGVVPSWDNTARKKENSTIFYGSSPLGYQQWLTNAIRDTVNRFSNHDHRLVFINAWNEWAEGAHLEPDARYGYAYLNSTLRALLSCCGSDTSADITEETSSRHKSGLDARWNRVKALFDETPDRGVYGFLCDYVALLAQALQHGALLSIEDHVPYCKINSEKIFFYRRESLSRLGSFLNNKGIFCFVILQYNKVELTELCVASIRKLDQCGRNVHIIIVDNKSSDKAIARTQKVFGTAADVTVLYSDTNLGFSGGNNLGYKYAREELHAEFMVILNNDTEIEQSEFIEKAVELYDQWSYSIAGPDIITPDDRHENPWNDYVYSIEEFESLRTIRCQEREHYLSHNKATFNKIGKVTPESEILINPILQGAAYIVSPVFISDHDKIFDERLFLYGEEFLLAVDCLLSGHLTIYTNMLEVRHHEGASTRELPPHDKLMFGYDSAIKAINLTLKRLERHRAASFGNVFGFAEIDNIDDCLDHNVPNVLVDLLFCQPGYHGGGEYGKAVFKTLAETQIRNGGVQLWVALDPNLFIDPWVWEMCKDGAINIIAVTSYNDIVQVVNSDSFDSFFTPAIVVYTGYEYMGKVGGHLPFTCKKTRVIGTLHDIRDFELGCNRKQILETRRRIGCLKELKMSESEINHVVQTSLDQAVALRRMYRAIINDENIDTVVTISSYCENSIKSNIGSPRKPLKVLASPQKRRPAPESFSSEKFNPTTSQYALLMHAAREEKNGASAVVAFDQLFEESNNSGLLSDFHVVLMGVTHLDQLGLAQIRYPDRFITLSELAPGQFEYLLKHARFLVYPSFNEGFGYPPIEVMSYGVPSIVSNVAAIPEVCGQAVKYFDPYNLKSIKEAILSILNDGIEKGVIFEQYNSVTEKQNADLETLVRLIVGKSGFGRKIVCHQIETKCVKEINLSGKSESLINLSQGNLA